MPTNRPSRTRTTNHCANIPLILAPGGGPCATVNRAYFSVRTGVEDLLDVGEARNYGSLGHDPTRAGALLPRKSRRSGIPNACTGPAFNPARITVSPQKRENRHLDRDTWASQARHGARVTINASAFDRITGLPRLDGRSIFTAMDIIYRVYFGT